MANQAHVALLRMIRFNIIWIYIRKISSCFSSRMLVCHALFFLVSMTLPESEAQSNTHTLLGALNVTANYSIPNVTETYENSTVLVSCSSSNGYPLEEVKWFLDPNQTQWRILTSSNSMDNVSQLFTVNSSIVINCSSGQPINLSCAVGGAVSQKNICCPPRCTTENDPIDIKAACLSVAVLAAVAVAAVYVLKCKKCKPPRPNIGVEQGENQIPLTTQTPD
ncbi:hypothetical protein DPEC_G00243140 [Dallia pectoralis]|uniref:Uncharacterized protein n=1 Tax=Dallia pectoralis TaxID=75939 RepID=A0ACC2FVB9_DALPE|nr:hypothetical protein DPEC_G00243140 [Dallia pectoralis]